jgi:hypothetical protein
VTNTVVSAEDAKGIQQQSDMGQVGSPETYLGYERAENFASPERQAANAARQYTAPAKPALNQWGLAGNWLSQAEQITLNQGAGSIVYRFHARDLHLVLGPGKDGKPVRFRVSIDGAAPGRPRRDVAADGSGTVDRQRLYQLVRQSGDVPSAPSASNSSMRAFKPTPSPSVKRSITMKSIAFKLPHRLP